MIGQTGLAWKHVRFGIVVFVFVLLTLAYVAVSRPEIYQARTLILFALGREYVYVPDNQNSDVQAPNPGDFQGVVNAEMLLLENPQLSRTAIEKVGLNRIFPDLPETEEGYRKATLQLQAATRIELITGSYVVKVAVRHVDPEISAELANALTDQFFEIRRELYAERETARLREQLVAANEQADEISNDISALVGEREPRHMQRELEAASNDQAHLSSLLREAQARLAALERRQTFFAAQLGLEGERMETEAEMQQQSAQVAFLRTAIAENEEKIARLAGLMPELQPLLASEEAQAKQILDLRLRLRESEALEGFEGEGNVRVIEKAVPPLQSITMPLKVQLAVAGLVSMLAAALATWLAFLLDRYRRGAPAPSAAAPDADHGETRRPAVGATPMRLHPKWRT